MIAKAKSISFMVIAALLATISCHGDAVNLAWDASPDAVAGYALHYAVTGDSQTNRIDVGNTTMAAVGNLAPGQTYVFYATAYDNNAVESDPSNTITYTAPYSTNTSHFVRADTTTRGNWRG